jgi:hypothetical protein
VVLTVSILEARDPTDSRNGLPPFALGGAGVIDTANNVLQKIDRISEIREDVIFSSD